jgi:hypothetical protein
MRPDAVLTTNPPSVGPERLLQRLDALAVALRQDAEALGLLALGSVGAETARLDAWSDLDFFVIVKPAAKTRYLEDLAWLAAAHPLAWSFRNTGDGHKALMTDGVLCEFAVFAPAELATVPYAPGRWVWRRESLDSARAQPAVALPRRREEAWLVGEALSNLVVGLMRHARGERLAAMRMVQVYALDRVLELAAGADLAAGVDPFNPDRRIEARAPALAACLPRMAGGYDHTVPAARVLLQWLQMHHEVPTAVALHIEALAAACERAGGSADMAGRVTPG